MMNTMAASGGYYVACGANRIVANKFTMTGSIGVIISTVDVSGLLDWAKVKPEFYTSGKMKTMLNPAKPTTEEEQKVIKALVMNACRFAVLGHSHSMTETVSQTILIRSFSTDYQD